MRVLVVDQDITMLERVSRLLGDVFSVDTVSSKASCLDLLRQNEFEVVIATERLADGSGLELLGQIGQRWPTVHRIFAADAHRLALLAHRLRPFKLFRSVRYPLDADELMRALVAAHQDGNGEPQDVTVEHVELGSEESPAQACAGAASAHVHAPVARVSPAPAPPREPAPPVEISAATTTSLPEARAAARSGLARAHRDSTQLPIPSMPSSSRPAVRLPARRSPRPPAPRARVGRGSTMGLAAIAVLLIGASAGVVLLSHSHRTGRPHSAPATATAPMPSAPTAGTAHSGTLARPAAPSHPAGHRSRARARAHADPLSEPVPPVAPEDFGPPRPSQPPAPAADTFSGRTLEQSGTAAPQAP